MRSEIHQGVSLREAIQIAHSLGIEVRWPKATGEVLFVHPEGRARVNSRRHDASRELVSLLRRVAAGRQSHFVRVMDR
jgi:hypothetical protein